MAWTIDGSCQGEYTGAIILRPGRSTDRAGAETQVKLIRNPKSEDSSEIRNPKSEGRRRRYPEQNPEVAGRHYIESRSRGGGTRIQNPEYRIQNPEKLIQNPESRIQTPFRVSMHCACYSNNSLIFNGYVELITRVISWSHPYLSAHLNRRWPRW